MLHADRVICSSLKINRSLLLGILAEIKTLFEDFAEANGKYEKIIKDSRVDWDDRSEPGNDMMSLLCITTDKDTQCKMPASPSKRAEAMDRVRGLGTSITQTAKALRTIVIEPKRLVWAAVDKVSFENLISKIENLNSFLIALLDSSQLRRLQDITTNAYLEVLQLRNDIVDLTALVKGLSPAAWSLQSRFSGFDAADYALSQAALEEQTIHDKRKSYLKRLAQVKIQLTKTNEIDCSAATSDLSESISAQLPLVDLQFENGMTEFEELRTRATYYGRSVWIEWKDAIAHNAIRPNDVQIQLRIGLLTDLLRSVKPDDFRAAPCLGYIKTTDTYGTTRFGVVFERPSTKSKITTLRELLGSTSKPSLSARMALCATLARCIHSLHAVNWLHKAVRADNIVFFSTTESPNLGTPFVSGFELSRPSNMDQWSEKPEFEPAKDTYRHPNAQSSQSDGTYRKSYDIYSLGIVMTEIALWKRIEDVLRLEDLPKAKPLTLQGIPGQLLERSFTENDIDTESCMQQIASACGDSLRNAVEHCLTMDTELKLEFSSSASRPPDTTVLDLAKKLEHVAETI